MRVAVLLWTILSVCCTPVILAGEDLLKELKKVEVWSSLEDPRIGGLPLSGKVLFVLRHSPRLQENPPNVLVPLILEKHRLYYQKIGRNAVLSLIWNAQHSCCKEWFHNGLRFKSYLLPAATVTVFVQEEDKYFRAWVHVSSADKDGPQFVIAPEQVRLLQVFSKFAWVERVPAESIARSIMRKARWQAAFIGMSGILATKTATINTQGNYAGQYSGTTGSGYVHGTYSGYSTITLPDEAAQTRALMLSQQIVANSVNAADTTVGLSLKQTTVFPGRQASGYVYFKRDKKLSYAILQVQIGDMSFEFPLERQSK